MIVGGSETNEHRTASHNTRRKQLLRVAPNAGCEHRSASRQPLCQLAQIGGCAGFVVWLAAGRVRPHQLRGSSGRASHINFWNTIACGKTAADRYVATLNNVSID